MTIEMTPVGATSRWIAAARALESEYENPLFVDPYARELAGEKGFALPAGSGLEVPAGAAHTAANHGSEAAQCLVVSQPPAHGDREPA